jgi:hypothetical protein
MSRRLLNTDDLGASSSSLLSGVNPMDIVKPKPVIPQHYVPNEPIFLTKEQWDFVCSKTHDATVPFKVEVTVIDKSEEDEGVEEEKEQEDRYVPKRTRKSKK